MKSFPISEASPIEHDAFLPKDADCVVIGGGIIGVTTALYLARQGQKVVVLEKGRIAAEQSSRNWGWIRVQGRDIAEIPIALEARRLWTRLASEVDTNIGLVEAGVAYLASKPSDITKYQSWLDYVQGHDLDSHMLSRAETQTLIPDAKTAWLGALWTPSDLRAEPFVAVPAIARLAASQGVIIIENCAARMLDFEAGKLAGIVTEKGRIRTPNIVLAGGAWSSLLLRRHGVNIPQLSVRATVAQTNPMGNVFAGGAGDNRLAFRKRFDGGYTLAKSGFHEFFLGPDAVRAVPKYMTQLMADPTGTKYKLAAPKHYPDAWGTPRRWAGDQVSPFERMRILDPAPNMHKVGEILRDFGKTFPQLGPVKLKSAWAGMIDVMPDVVPVVDCVDKIPGLVIATGMCGHGFGIGPAFGRIAADLVLGRDPGHDLQRFRLSRFSDGSKMTLGPSL